MLVPKELVLRLGASDAGPCGRSDSLHLRNERSKFIARFELKFGPYHDDEASIAKWMQVLTSLEDQLFLMDRIMDDPWVPPYMTRPERWQGWYDAEATLMAAAKIAAIASAVVWDRANGGTVATDLIKKAAKTAGPWGCMGLDWPEINRNQLRLMHEAYLVEKRGLTSLALAGRAVACFVAQYDRRHSNRATAFTYVIACAAKSGADMTETQAILDDLWRRLDLHDPKRTNLWEL